MKLTSIKTLLLSGLIGCQLAVNFAQDQVNLDLRNVPSGVYLLTLENAGARVSQARVVKH